MGHVAAAAAVGSTELNSELWLTLHQTAKNTEQNNELVTETRHSKPKQSLFLFQRFRLLVLPVFLILFIKITHNLNLIIKHHKYIKSNDRYLCRSMLIKLSMMVTISIMLFYLHL